jgi:hypothetical protein
MRSLMLILLVTSTVAVYGRQSNIEAKQYANDVGLMLMKKISPYTGSACLTQPTEIEYDASRQIYTMELVVSWKAYSCWLCEGGPDDFMIKGYLTIGRNGSNPRFKTVYKNSAVSNAEAWDLIANAGAEILLQATSSSSNSSSSSSSSSTSSKSSYPSSSSSSSSSYNNNSTRPAIPGKYPFASTRYLTSSDLDGLSKWELSIMRNEIYARHGYNFHINKKVRDHFLQQSWYNEIGEKTTNANYIHQFFSDIEKKNIQMIQKYEK